VGAGGSGTRLHADDVGLSDGVNAEVDALLAAGRLAGVSLVANGPATATAAGIVAGFPAVPVHLHLNLTEGSPLAEPAGLGAMVTPDGTFLGLRGLTVALVRRRIAAAAVRLEIEAQLARLAVLGVRVTAIDSHHHVHALAPVGEVVAEVAGRNGLRVARSYGLVRTRTLGGATRKTALSLLARSTQWAVSGRASLPAGWRPQDGEHDGPFAVASWEPVHPDRRDDLTIVCHPGGSCDRDVGLDLGVRGQALGGALL
jgi:predicted glycoside hydrolase/deacetylase ChbG (UPF0249 family)